MLFLTAASTTVVIILLKRLVMFAGRLRACLHCGCQLNTGAKACLLCGHTLKPRVAEHVVASVRSQRATDIELASRAKQPPVTRSRFNLPGSDLMVKVRFPAPAMPRAKG